ncbi:MAG: phospholipase D-like domain-containing protein [Candidatus Woesearchaeota archaeon]
MLNSKQGIILVQIIVFLIVLFTVVSKGHVIETDVVFCQVGDCYDAFETFFIDATHVRCAFYDLNPEIGSVFLNIPDAEIIIERQNADKSLQADFIGYDGNSAAMHHKFCIVDFKKVLTGSTNPTHNGFSRNDNNIILLESEVVAAVFLEEYYNLRERARFEYDYEGGSFSIATMLQRLFQSDSYMSQTHEIFFCPQHNCAGNLIQEIRNAQDSIYIATFAFTDMRIASELILAEQRGVVVKGVIERRGGSRMYTHLSEHGITMFYDNHSGTMHHKYFVFDEHAVWSGSYNPSLNGNYRNNENIVVIRDALIASQFIEEWYRINKQ